MHQKTQGKIVVKISIIWFFVAIITIGLASAFFKNKIFATNVYKEEKQIVPFEKNQKALDIIEILLENTNSNKKMVNEKRDVAFAIKYEENPNLPKDEEQVKQEGKNGKIQVTALQEFQNEEMINEEIVESTILEDVVTQIVYVGTSEFMKNYNVHLDDNMYLLEAEDLKVEAKDDSDTIINIPRYLNVTLKEAGEEWIKVSYKGQEGYLKTANITSETVTPLITEKNRIAELKNNLNIDMDLTISSGLTLSDYKTILSNNSLDKNKIFEQNAEIFYNAEQKYKINGMFLVAIGIHESGWGTSKIALEKGNLFGYRAYDSDPYNSASTFENYAEGINIVAEALATRYLYVNGTQITDELTARGTYFSGSTIQAVNTRYASDPGWYEKVYGYMQYLYNRL